MQAQRNQLNVPVNTANFSFIEKTARLLHFKTIGLVVILLLFASGIRAQQNTDYAVQANIIYHITKYINWPDNKKTGDFIIGIVGDSPLYDQLKITLANKKAGTQNIVIKKISSSAASFTCHILFLSEDESDNIKKINSRTSGHATLMISESEGLARKGACINFAIAEDKLKLEINKHNIEDRGLDIASELLQLGQIVK